MRSIQDSRISYENGVYKALCVSCGKQVVSRYKSSIRKTLDRKSCRGCKIDHRNDGSLQQSQDGRWLSHCPDCGAEQKYTRKSHAKSSTECGWLCRKCARSNANLPVGHERRMYNKFRKSANNRGISWQISFDDFVACFNGQCALTGWKIGMEYNNCTASLDRIDSTKPYTTDNIQWVHSMVNMCKNKYSQQQFVEMCRAVSEKVKW